MNRRARIGLALAALAWAGGASAADALRPVQMVRSLQLVQDRVAAGDHAALPMQKKLLEMIDARLRSGDAAELGEPANFRAALVYAMSGGNPATLAAVVDKLSLSEEDSRRAVGVASYLNGEPKAALVSLKAIDPLKEPAELAAFLALVKGSVTALDSPVEALKLLDQARLLAPGTLVAESALRRSVALEATMGEPARFLLASEQYVRAFLRSPYASQFADSFVAGIVALHETIDLARVETIVSLMMPEQQQVIYLRLARRAAIDGLTGLSRFASAKTTVADVPADDPRALLYSSLAGVATVPNDAFQQSIARIDRARLSPGDLKLLDAVTTVSSEMTRVPGEVPAPTTLPKAADELVPETAEPAIVEASAVAPAAEVPVSPAPEAAAPAIEQAAASEPAKDAVAVEATPEPAAADPADIALAAGRKKLDEIDQLLAKAAK